MKNRYLRAAVWMLTVLMVLSCLPMAAMAEGTVTDNSPALAAVDLLDGSRSVDGGGDGITASTTSRWGIYYTTNWTIPVYLYSENDDGTLSALAKSAINAQSSGSYGLGWSSTPTQVSINESNSVISALLRRYQYSSVRYVIGNSAQSTTTVSELELETTGTNSTSLSYDSGSIASSEYENNAIFVIIKLQGEPFTVTVSGNEYVTLSADYPTTVESANGDLLTITLPTGAQVEVDEEYMITGWQDSFGNECAPGEEVIIGATTEFTPLVEALLTVKFVQNTDGSGAGQSRNTYVTNGSYLTFPELFSGWGIEGKTFVGWSTDIQGDGTGDAGVFAPNTQWMSSATSAVPVTSNTTFYAIWIEDTSTTTHDAYFFIRLDGQIPFEPSNDKSPNSYTTGHELTGTIRTTVSVNNNNELVEANIVNAPSKSDILTRLKSDTNTYDDLTVEEFEADYRIVWYVIKYDSGSSHRHWHVDGIIVARDKYMVMYNPNGGSDAPLSHSHSVGEENIEVQFDPLPTRQGYTFLGWSEDPGAVSPTYTTSNNIMAEMPAHDVTLYAVWQASDGIDYTVQYFLQGPEGYPSTPTESQVYQGVTGSLVSAPQKSFEGYSVDTNYEDTVSYGTVEPDGSLVLRLYYKRDLGSLRLTKVVKNGDAVDESNTSEFTFVVSGLSEDDIGRTISVSNHSQVLTGTSFEVSVPANDDVLITGVPTGELSVTEKGVTDKKVTVDGKVYDVEVSGAEVTITKGGEATATITNTLSTTSVDVTKDWSDNSNAYGTRPAQITVHLMNGTTVAGTVTVAPVTDADTQTITFSGVSIYDASGNAINYTAAEEPVAGYETTVDGTTITNTLKTYSLDVSKIVTGNFGDVNKEFSFTAKLLTGADAATTVTTGSFENGTTSFTLKHNGTQKLTGIPYGYKVLVEEISPSPYTVTNNSAEGAAETATIGAFGVMADDSAAVTFTNTYNAQIDTGVDLDTIPYVVMLLSIFGAGALWLIGRRRRTQN